MKVLDIIIFIKKNIIIELNEIHMYIFLMNNCVLWCGKNNGQKCQKNKDTKIILCKPNIFNVHRHTHIHTLILNVEYPYF